MAGLGIKRKKSLSKKELAVAGVLVVGLAVGTVGLLRELLSQAATPTASSEIEKGTITSPAKAVVDSTASGGSAIQFVAPSTSVGFDIGTAYGGNADPTVLEGRLGAALESRRTYFGPTGQSSAANVIKADIAAGRKTSSISFKLPYSWAEMANGAGDTWAKNLLTTLQAANTGGHKVRIAFHHEPENDTAPNDGATIAGRDAWKNMQARLAPIFDVPDFQYVSLYDISCAALSSRAEICPPCISALKWAVAEMERRLKTMAEVNRRNIVEYNNLKKEEGMPYIVIVIDELADLMMMAARDVESLIVRLAQKARAAGIHLVLATQRPSVDVITGLIKANVPARIAFTVASGVDSKTIIDGVGAEKLLGQGDMLLLTSDMPKPKRVQGAFIDDAETMKVTDFIRMQRPPQYDDEIISQPVQLNGKGGVVMEHGGGSDADDDMFRDAVRAVIEARKASTSLLQRRLRIGYGRAARLVETMEEQGIVGPADGSRPREVLVSSLDEVFGGGSTSDEVLEENFPDNNETPRDRFLVQ